MLRHPAAFRVATIALLLAVLGTGLAFLAIRAGQPAQRLEIILPASSPASEAVVYLSGAGLTEGLYTLREGDRVADAVQAAGGLAPDADRARVNLAARATDEMHIHVPRIGEASAGDGLQGDSAAAGLINVNTATQEELERLPGIGPGLATAIIEYREANGGFSRIEDLLNVPRVGEATLASLRPFASVR